MNQEEKNKCFKEMFAEMKETIGPLNTLNKKMYSERLAAMIYISSKIMIDLCNENEHESEKFNKELEDIELAIKGFKS